MNFSQRLGLFILILISVIYVYGSFFNTDLKIPEFFNRKEIVPEYNPIEESAQPVEDPEIKKEPAKKVKIYIIDKAGEISPVSRDCDSEIVKSCFAFAIDELLKSPTKWEKSKGFTSEIPSSTKVLSVRESANSVMLDLSSDFESGGGAESTYMRIKQIIKTSNANTNLPVYLYINGKQVNVVGGEGVMIKQPLNDKSLDEG